VTINFDGAGPKDIVEQKHELLDRLDAGESAEELQKILGRIEKI